MKILLFILLLFPFDASAADKDLATVLIFADWATTHKTIGDDRFKEHNPILGDHPTHRQLNLFMVSQLALHYFFNNTKYRDNWNFGIIVTKSIVVTNNIYVLKRF